MPVLLDLKPENLLIANNSKLQSTGLDAGTQLSLVEDALKICDFGLATLFRSQTTKEERKLTTYCGTAPYSSPEVGLSCHRSSIFPLFVVGLGENAVPR